MMLKRIIGRIRENRRYSSLRDNEDLPILKFINKIYKGNEITFLEVGSGECRFVKKIRALYPNVKITCVEINLELASIARNLGVEVINDNILNIKPSNEYDLVHCSHVIEHFGYPEITNVLDFLVNSCKENGHIIIRTPLMHDKFYNDVDHVRPYPPKAVQNYFNYTQQQKKSSACIKVLKLWYRTKARKIEHLNNRHLFYLLLRFIRPVYNMIVDWINRMFLSLWVSFRSPSSKPTGYVMIMKLLSK